MRTIVLISGVYPFGSVTETSFITPEIEPLSRAFDRVIISPLRKQGESLDVPLESLPPNVVVSESMLINPTLLQKVRGMLRLLRPILYDCRNKVYGFRHTARRDRNLSGNGCETGHGRNSEVGLNAEGSYRHGKGSFQEIVAYTAYVDIIRRNVEKLISEYRLNLSETLFYTFWFDFATAAVSLIPGTRIVTRSHGRDLYEDRNFISPYWREWTLKRLEGVYLVSEAGREYLSGMYPSYKDKFFLHRLGTVRPMVTASHTEAPSGEAKAPIAAAEAMADAMAPGGVGGSGLELDGKKVRLVGIARLSPEKGVVRQFEYVREYALRHPERSVCYTHVGDGALRSKIEEIVTQSPANLHVELKGALHNSEVHRLLSGRGYDAMLLLSCSEGGCPIALCEAYSYGVPAIATAVGGIREVLGEGGGELLSPEPDYEEFEKAVDRVLDNKEALSAEAVRIWENDFEAGKLREAFVERLKALSGKEGSGALR